MAEAVDQASHEFWRPPMPVLPSRLLPERSATCSCGTEFIVCSLHCHACGAKRADPGIPPTPLIPGWFELVSSATGSASPCPPLSPS